MTCSTGISPRAGYDRPGAQTPTSDIRVQSCGDAHLLNFGMYAAPTGAWFST